MLQCPQCGSETFYIEREDRVVYFSVNEAGEAVDVMPPEEAVVLSPDTIIYCTVCTWNGVAGELKQDV